jgi:hypothetical protein
MGLTQQTLLIVCNCGHCGNTFLQNQDPQRRKTYCSRRCKDNSEHMRKYYNLRVVDPAKLALKMTRNQRNAAAWRESMLARGLCVRCGRENDRAYQSLKLCTNCVIALKGGP